MFRRGVFAFGKKGKVGYAIPEANVFTGVPPKPVTTTDLFGGKRVFLVTVPGAYTGNCNCQLPEYASKASELKQRFNVSEVYCATTNDSFVAAAWAKEMGVDPQTVTVISDPGHSLLKQLGLEIDLPVLGGDRFARAAMVLDDAKIEQLWKEEDGKALDATKVDTVLSTSGENAE